MKFKLLFAAMLASLFLANCSFLNNKIVYEFEKDPCEFEFQATNTDTVIQKQINLYTYSEINTRKNEPLTLEFDFWESSPNVRNLKSIKLKLFSVDNNQSTELKARKSEINIDYHIEGGSSVNFTKPNGDQLLNKMINWNEVNYEYEFLNVKYKNDFNTVGFHGEEVFDFEEYPEKLKVSITMIWKNGERTFETYLLKKKYEKPKRRWDLKY